MEQYEDLCMRLYWDCQGLNTKLVEGGKELDRKKCIIAWLDTIDSKYPRIPDFKSEYSWFNVSTPVTMDRLEGQVTLLDFFTYCCINCMHILPDLERLEEKWGRKGLVVVGVHSAKFENEKVGEHLGHAIARYNIRHPVCNDSQATMWSTLGVTCWPTQLVLGPHGRPVWVAMGEGHGPFMEELVEIMVEHYGGRGLLTGAPVEVVENSEVGGSVLQYPGKVEVVGERVVVSDSGHHRVLVVDKEGRVVEIVGEGKAGYKDGGLSEAQFNNPQGVCVVGDRVYVCDTDNHRVRCVDLQARQVNTVVGTGVMGMDKEGGRQGVEQEISSPWDLCLIEQGGGSGLLVAMAGSHQMWLYCLSDITWWKGVTYKQGIMVRVVGSGMEENRNNSYPHKAGLAQPSGICCDQDWVYLADSESSTVRKVNRKDGAVKNLCGGERDPTNLFAYGDVDGDGVAAKLQHPLGVTVGEQGEVFIADSYNHKVKVVTGSKGSVKSVVGGGENDATQLSEPGGLCVDGEKMYVADTNNHCVKVVDLATGSMQRWDIVMQDMVDSPDTKAIVSNHTLKEQEGSVTLTAKLSLGEGAKVNPEAPSTWSLTVDSPDWAYPAKGKVESVDLSIPLQHPAITPGQVVTVELSARIYICTAEGLCMVKTVKHMARITVGGGGGDVLDLGKLGL